MAKYGKKARQTIAKTMHEYGEGKLKSGGKSKTPVKNREQAVAIGISKARHKGEKVPARSS